MNKRRRMTRVSLDELKRNARHNLHKVRRKMPDIEDIKHNVKKLKVPEKAREHHEKIRKQISKNIPANGKQLGKQIERNISSSNKIWSNVSVAFFSQRSLENLTHFSNYFLGLLMLLLTDIVVIFPTDRASLAPEALVTNFLTVMAGLLIVQIITFVAMKAMGSKIKFKVYFSTANTALFMSILVFSIPISLISFALFSTMIASDKAINMFFSMVPFYNFLIFGWSSETLSRLKGIKPVIVALIALMLVLFFKLIFAQIAA